MLPLLLAIAASATMSLVLKLSETRRLERYAVVAINYIAAATGAALLGGGLEWPLPAPEGALLAIADALATGARVDDLAGPAWAGGFGLVTGGLLFLGLTTYQIAIGRHGVGLAAAMARLGVLVPMTLSIAVWGEHPRSMQWAGIGLALGAILAANWPEGETRWRDALRPALVAVLVCVGLSEFSSKVFQRYGHLPDKPVFLFVAFATAGAIAWIALAARRRRFGWAEVAAGVAVGVPNLFSIGSLVDALDTLPAAVVFPVFGAGSLLIVQLGGVLWFGERPGLRGWLAMWLTLFAVVLINL